jgi:hypothetical protein
MSFLQRAARRFVMLHCAIPAVNHAGNAQWEKVGGVNFQGGRRSGAMDAWGCRPAAEPARADSPNPSGSLEAMSSTDRMSLMGRRRVYAKSISML